MRNGALAKSNVVSATYEDAGDWLVDFSTDADGARYSMTLYHCGFAVSRSQGTLRDA
ncbi:hypothetical protein F5Y01DRAFT_317189 [Xylaria sp. FL0043]|nr:hypothetical protein F5Y01DRAFT_317189 [Xylaria sp. FL0043]